MCAKLREQATHGHCMYTQRLNLVSMGMLAKIVLFIYFREKGKSA